MTKIGYFLASEENGPNVLVRQAELAERDEFFASPGQQALPRAR